MSNAPIPNLSIYSTKRLYVEAADAAYIATNKPLLMLRAVELLTPAVTSELPPYFQNVTDLGKAEQWLTQVSQGSRLFVVTKMSDQQMIGFMFVYPDDQSRAHLGYLLGENYWRQGFALELLEGFITWAEQEREFTTVIAGVSQDNTPSQKLLNKLGFSTQGGADNTAQFYHYHLRNSENRE
ncbi:GNAT family N-acetyltransferase [Agarivorans sp. 1_MG-2023]|uniref:GNAT family N-acetyltransferase n=1 Tax=Agarivorans sp. 1_MG-2023 TaxID=3062634 RepID=UPI0026E117AE|nr:GNAT family N-acetyltransferase [Agarivorans sp. 1_MG-2023]MDO6762056.1 GNAT family N-acetyltransferase [Agarivorans sp. 1_MG-2023]